MTGRGMRLTRAVTVRRQWLVCADIKMIELVAADGQALPAAQAGAHIDVHLPDGVVRQYSITNPGLVPPSYFIAVLCEPHSRGGSTYLVNELRSGDSLSITGPRNNFVLDETAGTYRLIAGGIGVTPLIAMARRLVELGRDVEFHYLVRSRIRTAFLDDLAAWLPAHALHVHVDEEDGRPDLRAIVGDAGDDAQIYACGPEPMLAAIGAMTNGWPAQRVHVERFSNAARLDSGRQADGALTCRVELQRSGVSFDLQAGETLLDAIEREHADVPCLCREGICGTCAVRVLEGDVDHCDAIQDEDEKFANKVIYVCVSRPTGARLVLDL